MHNKWAASPPPASWVLLFKTYTAGRALFSAAVLWAVEALRHHLMGRVFGFYFNILCIWMLFSLGFFSSSLLGICTLRSWGRGQCSVGITAESRQRAGVEWSGRWDLGGRCEDVMFPHAWLQLSLPLCSTSQPTRICTIPSGKIISVARESMCVEKNNQSKENGWNK